MSATSTWTWRELEHLGSQLVREWEQTLLPAHGCVAVANQSWCRNAAIGGSSTVVLVEPMSASVPFLLKLKLGSPGRVQDEAVQDEAMILRDIAHRARHSPLHGQVVWTSSAFHVGGKSSSNGAHLGILQQRILHVGTSRASACRTGNAGRFDCLPMHGAHRRHIYQMLQVSVADGIVSHALLARIASQVRSWSDVLWQEQLLVGDLQFLLNRRPARSKLDDKLDDMVEDPNNAALHLFDPRKPLSSWDPKLASSQLPRLLRMQRLELLSLSMNVALMALNRSGMLEQSLCSQCTQLCHSYDWVHGVPTLIAWVPSAARDAFRDALSSCQHETAREGEAVTKVRGGPCVNGSSPLALAAQVGMQSADELSTLLNRVDHWATADPAEHNHAQEHCASSVERHCDASWAADGQLPPNNATAETKMRSRGYMEYWLDARPQAEHCAEWPPPQPPRGIADIKGRGAHPNGASGTIRCSLTEVSDELNRNALSGCRQQLPHMAAGPRH